MRAAYREQLDELSAKTDLCAPLGDGAVRCLACAHRCRIAPGRRGICGVRFNRDGFLYAPWGYTSSLALDPIEKKPLFHVLPGTGVLSFGMLGCSFHCPFCQNWSISQTLRDDQAVASPRRCTADRIVDAAVEAGAESVAATYNEPLIAVEWVAAVFRAAQARGLRTCIVSNGFASAEGLSRLRPCLNAANIDLKCFTENGYRSLGGHLQPVLDAIGLLHREGVWVEVTTLVVPGFNDSDAELRAAAGFLAGVSADVPWHVSAFHPDYRMVHGAGRTPERTILGAVAIGKACGLRHVYSGNLGGAATAEDTCCPSCGTTLVVRRGFAVCGCRLTGDGKCPRCSAVVAGVWR